MFESLLVEFISDFSSTTISGLSEVAIDFIEQIYDVSMSCPSNRLCAWMLDNCIIVLRSSTSVKLTFRPDQIGHHTLSYVGIIDGSYRVLVSHSISVKPKLETGNFSYRLTCCLVYSHSE
jgi:hypothetical protein